MSLKNQKSRVRYQGRDDFICAYGIRDDGKQFYYLDAEGKPLKNGNYIASTALVEAIDPMVKASNIGMIDSEGKEVIPFTNRSIRPVNDDIVLVEPATPTTQSVIEAVQLKSDPLSATKLVSTPALIKEKLNAKVNGAGKYLFNDQFSEATICDINGNNLVNGASYSFIITDGKTIYSSQNTADSEISSYSILPPEVQSDVTADNTEQAIDVTNVSVPQDVVENALNNSEVGNNVVAEESNVVTENAAPTEEVVQNNPATEEPVNAVENVASENALQENVQDTNMETGFEIPKVDTDIPNLPSEVVPPAVDTAPVEAPAVDAAPVEVPVAENAEVPTEEVQEPTAEVTVEESVEVPSGEVENTVPVEEKSTEAVEKVTPVAEGVSVNEEEQTSEEVVEDNKDADDTISSIAEETNEEIPVEEATSFDSTVVDTNEDEDLALNIGDDLDEETFDMSSATDDLDNYDDIVDNFGDVQIDHISDSITDDFGEEEYHEDLVPDAINTINDLVNKYQVASAELSEVNASRRTLKDQNNTLKQQNQIFRKKIDMASSKNQALEAKNAQLMTKLSLYEDRISAKDEIIRKQQDELNRLRPLQRRTEELFNVVASAQEMLNERQKVR